MERAQQSSWWKPKPDPWAYTSLLERAHAAIKAANPGATVIAAGLAPAPDATDGSQINGETFVRRMYQAGARGNFDALGMHRDWTWKKGWSAFVDEMAKPLP